MAQRARFYGAMGNRLYELALEFAVACTAAFVGYYTVRPVLHWLLGP